MGRRAGLRNQWRFSVGVRLPLPVLAELGGWDCWEWSLGLHPGRQAGSMPASSTRTYTTLALVAQWTRVPGFEPGGWRFESSRGLSRWGCIGNAAIPSGCKPPASGSGSSTLSVPTPSPASVVHWTERELAKLEAGGSIPPRGVHPRGEWGLAIRQLSYGCAKPVRFRRSLSMVAVAQTAEPLGVIQAVPVRTRPVTPPDRPRGVM